MPPQTPEEEPRRVSGQDDVLGQDRLARSLLRVVGRMPPASLIAVHGAPGSGKSEFFRRLAWLAHVGGRASRTDTFPGILPAVVWYDPWAWSKQGGVLAGVVAAVTRSAPHPARLQDKARDIVSNLGKLQLDGRTDHGQTTAFSGLEADPIEAVVHGFVELVEMAKGGRKGRLLIFIDQMDRLSPELRLQVIDGVRLLLLAQPQVSFLLCVGRKAALTAIQHREGPISEEAASHELGALLDLSVTVPGLDVRRIGSLLAAVAHRPLGVPRLLRRLAWRVQLVAEYAQEIGVNRELTEAQWAWVIVSERWPEFRRFMIRGGRDRWVGLKQVAAAYSSKKLPPGGLRPEIVQRLEEDLLLADYLRLHADGFERDAEGIFWLETLLRAAGL
jgi:hypothetical protein